MLLVQFYNTLEDHISVLLDIKLVRDKKVQFLHALPMSTLPMVSAFLKDAGRHRLQKEWRQGKSFGSLLLKLSLQIGHVSISCKVLCCFVLSSSAGKLSASFSTIITISSLATAFASILWSGTSNSFQSINTTVRRGKGTTNTICFLIYMEHTCLQYLYNRQVFKDDFIRRVIASNKEENLATWLMRLCIRQIINSCFWGLWRLLFKLTVYNN